MKEYLTELVQRAAPAQKRNVAREYLQARILECLQRAGAMVPLAFHGGTALRFLFHLPRYSEDLDLALEGDAALYDLHAYLDDIRATLAAEGYNVITRLNERHTVHSGWVRFIGLLYELGLMAQREEALAIKIEVDTRPPAGAGLATTIVRRYVILNLQHHDKASLLAGKLHAILQRPYIKGRDIYDLLWYLADPEWPVPNLLLLNNALQQTGWIGVVAEDNWREVVAARLRELPWDRVRADVTPFLESPSAAPLTRENLLRLLGVSS